MIWFVSFRRNGAHRTARHDNPRTAIHAACWLIEQGYEVTGIRSGTFVDLVTQDELDRFYEVWEQTMRPDSPAIPDAANNNEAPNGLGPSAPPMT